MAIGIMIASFVVFFCVITIITFIVFPGKWLLGSSWIIMLLLLAPALTLLAETVIVMISAKAKTFMEAQQISVLVILPLILLMVGQFTGLYILGPLVLGIFSAVSAILAGILLRVSSGRFQSEKLLQ